MGLFSFLSRSSKAKELTGSFGEMLVKIYADCFTNMLVLHDVLIDGAAGRTSQIDLILIDPKGVYVVEVKSFEGAVIYGDCAKHDWYCYRGGKRFDFYNPKMQNEGHIRYLKKLLHEFGNVPYYSIVVLLCDDFNVSNINPKNRADTLICNSIPAMKRGIRQLTEGVCDALDRASVYRIFEYIKSHSYTGRKNKTLHTDQVKEYTAKQEQMKAHGLCPRCGSPLVLRTGQYGEFLGCSSYPSCRYTKKI